MDGITYTGGRCARRARGWIGDRKVRISMVGDGWDVVEMEERSLGREVRVSVNGRGGRKARNQKSHDQFTPYLVVEGEVSESRSFRPGASP